MGMVRVGLSALMVSAAFVTPALADTTKQFDLICTSTHFSVSSSFDRHGELVFGPTLTIDDGPVRLHVDLVSNQWCEGDCKEVDAIESVTDSIYVFSLRKEYVGDTVSVKRQTAEYFRQEPEAKDGTRHTGTCAAAPFTPFPKPKL
jgi:hypothetical protein